MRKIFLGLLIITQIIFLNLNAINPELLIAIEKSDLNNFKYYLSYSPFKEEDKKLLLGTAEDAIRLRLNKISIFKSGNDMLRMFIGYWILTGGLCATGGGLFLSAIFNEAGKDEALIGAGLLTLAGLGISALGINQLLKGWNLKSSYTSLKNAYQIKELIQNSNYLQYNTKKDNSLIHA